jgi:organic radical activating enzyme
MNIALTYFCNQRCAYCFGIDAMYISKCSIRAREMTLDNLKKVMEFMKKSDISQFNMIGGEPTLHSRFEEIYEAVLRNGFSVAIFSNGVIDRQRVEFLREKDNLIDILLNIREPKEYSERDWKKIEYTLSQLNNKITLSFRIYRMDFDPRFLFDLIDEYKLNRLINWAIACPSLINNNVYVQLEDHEKAVERMVKFSRISKERNINWYTDSGFILCAFFNRKLEELRKNVRFVPATNCYPPVEVAPDLKVFRCFGMSPTSRSNLKITDFKNLKEAESYFFSKSLPFKRIGGMDKCFGCEHIISQKCGGGCMVHILKRFRGYKNLLPIF